MAVAQSLQRRESTDVLLFGPVSGRAADLANDHGFRFQPVRASAIARVGAVGVAAAGFRTLAGIADARAIIQRERLQLVVAFGGYASGAVVLAARSRGCATVILEANAILGIANRLLARVADRACVSEWTSRAAFPRDRVVVTGWPMRDDMNQLATVTREWPAAKVVRVLVSSGSRGGEFMATHVPLVLEQLMRNGLSIEVRHQAADANCAAIARAYAERGIIADVSASIADMASAYQWATLAIARAGAGTISELALAALPALLVPLGDAAENHQHANARLYAETGAALCMTEDEWREDEAAEALRNFVRPDSAQRASKAARVMATPNAAEAVVDTCEQLMRGRW